jgi:AraC-like DNA-binding protein
MAGSGRDTGVGAPAVTASRRGDLRIGPILGIPAVLNELGVPPERAFRQAGVDLRLFQDPENHLPLESVGRLFEACVVLTGCRHFGVLVGERFDLEAFGPLGALMRHSATVGDALHDLILYLHLYDRAGAPVLLAPDAGSVILGYSIYDQRTPAAECIYTTATTIAYRILRQLCGPGFEPLLVQFSYDRPASSAEYRRSFRSGVAFNAPTSGIVFASSWLSRGLSGAEPALHRELARAIGDADGGGPASFSVRLEGVLHQALLSGSASAADVARRLAIHERTLRRRVQAEGMSLRRLVNRTRFEIAGQLLRNTRLPVTEIAAAVQYADSSAFARAFRSWAKRSPREWRARR